MMISMELKYPIGDQSFESIRSSGYVYVDKSQYIEKLLGKAKYYFLSRPRRFGKSLFLSMLKFFFEGRRDLFKGLYADSMDWDWDPFPVFYLDLNTQRYKEAPQFEDAINLFLTSNEQKFGVEKIYNDISSRFSYLIKTVAERTSKKVVILVDEYDKPLVHNLTDNNLFNRNRDRLADLYANFKSSADYIQMVFMTGVSRFGKLSVFSGLNNISDISFLDEFGSICGITEDELLRYFRPGISLLADKLGHSFEEELADMKRWYDGYHFSEDCPDIYNPFSVLQLLSNKKYGNYWISSGTPSILVEQLKRTDSDLEKLLELQCRQNDLEGLDISNISPAALFYQTGYLTIKSYNGKRRLYKLGLPNEEVSEGFLEFILPYYTKEKSSSMALVFDFLDDLELGNVESFMKRLNSFFAGITYEMRLENESNVQNALFVLFKLLGFNCDVEYRTSDGRIDILIRTPKFVYIMEIKFDGSADEALDQIKRKEYHLPWAVDNRIIYAMGINYSSEIRRLDGWKSEKIE